MEATEKLQLCYIFTKYKIEQSDATFLSDIIEEIDNKQASKFQDSKEFFQ